VLLADRTRDVRTITTVVTEVLAANPETTPVIVGNSTRLASDVESGDALIRDVCSLICLALIGLFRSRASLQAEILTLRHQLNVLRRKSPQRLTFTSIDRLVFAGLYRLAPGVLAALKIVGPETVIRWHRAGFRAYWRWESKTAQWPSNQLIREISLETH